MTYITEKDQRDFIEAEIRADGRHEFAEWLRETVCCDCGYCKLYHYCHEHKCKDCIGTLLSVYEATLKKDKDYSDPLLSAYEAALKEDEDENDDGNICSRPGNLSCDKDGNETFTYTPEPQGI